MGTAARRQCGRGSALLCGGSLQMLAAKGNCGGVISYTNVKRKKEETPAMSSQDYRKMPSVVTWLNPKCFMQARSKTELFKAWMPHIECSQKCADAKETQQHMAGLYWYSLGCSEDEFRHIITSSNAPMGAIGPIRKVLVDLECEDVRLDLRKRWAEGRLFLKDTGPNDLFSKKNKRETLLQK